MDASLRQIRTFLAVARLRHVTRAARHLHLTQPAVTHQLRQLEAAMGVALVRKEGRGIGLTPAGEALAEGVLDPLDRLEASLEAARRGHAAETRGVVRIATLQSYNEALVIPAAAVLARSHSDVRVVSREMAGDAIEVALAEGRADLGLTFQCRRTVSLRAEPLMGERLSAVFLEEAFDDLPRRPTVRDVAARPLALLPRDYALRALVDDLAARERIALRVAFESTNIASLMSFAAHGTAIALVRELAVPPRTTLAVRPVHGVDERHVYLVRGPMPPSTVTELFASTLRKVIRTREAR